MKKDRLILRTFMGLALALLILPGCSKKPQASTNPSDLLNYSFEGEAVKQYTAASKVNMLIIAGGQEIPVDIENILSYSLSKISVDNDKIEVNIKIDSMHGVFKSMQGDMTTNPEELRNREFSMTISKKGDESGLEEAAQIEYTGVNGEKANLKSSFAYLFPDLPSGATGIGYTWEDNDTIDMSASGQTILMIINSKNTIAAREKYMGYDCFKITSTSTGERSQSGDSPAGYISSSGELTGTGYLYFAIKEGIVIKEHVDQKLEGDMTIPTGDTFPMYMDITMDNDLKK
jgi:hypothetical protein